MAQTTSHHPGKAHRKTGGADRAAQRARPAASGAAQEDLQWGEQPHALADAVAVLQRGWGNRATSAALDAQRPALPNGQPLPDPVRAHMESRFGTDFGRVRVHNDAQAHEQAQALSAKAFTQGEHIAFSADRFAPHSAEGQRLLAHELAHVVQQRRGGAAPTRGAQAPHEQAAQQAAQAVTSNPQAPVAVQGATGVGLACEEEDERSWYEQLRDQVPPEYRKMAKEAVKGEANVAVDGAATAMLGPFGSMVVPSDLGSGLVEVATGGDQDGNTSVVEHLKGAARDQLLGSLGAVSGVVKQVSEVADTGLWVGDEYAQARDTVASWAGDENSLGHQVVASGIDGLTQLTPLSALPNLADASQQVKDVGLTDDQGRASFTAPFSRWINDKAKQVETTVGGAPNDAVLFTPFERKEMEAAIASQVVLAFTGAEEVKVALNVVGALQSVRTTVETVRRSDNWKSDPQFWGGLIGIALSIVGLKHAAGASKFTTLLMKFGWTLQAVPLLLQMKDVYFTEGLSDEERERRVKALWAQVIHVLKDAILHVAQTQGGKPGKGAPAPVNPDAAQAGQSQAPKPAANKPPASPAAAQAQPKPLAQASAAPEAPMSAPIPIASGKGKAKSPQTRANDAHLADTGKGGGKVIPFRPKAATGEPTGPHAEPNQARLPKPLALAEPVGMAVPFKRAVGDNGSMSAPSPRASIQGDGTGQNAPPKLTPLVGGASKGSTPPAARAGQNGGAQPPRVARKPANAPTTQKKSGAPPKPGKQAKKPALKLVKSDPVEQDLAELRARVPLEELAEFQQASALVRATTQTNPSKVDAMIGYLERRWPGTNTRSQDIAQARLADEGRSGAERQASGKHTQEASAEDRARLDQRRPSGKQVRAARRRESERLGDEGGRAKSQQEGIEPVPFEPPQKWKGDYGRGIDDLGQRGGRTVVLEYKGGRSNLSTSRTDGTVQMSSKWVGKKIAELEISGEKGAAARLLAAADQGTLDGLVYRTRPLKAGMKTDALPAHSLRDKLSSEAIDADGTIRYDGKAVREAYQVEVDRLKAAVAAGDLKAIRNL